MLWCCCFFRDFAVILMTACIACCKWTVNVTTVWESFQCVNPISFVIWAISLSIDTFSHSNRLERDPSQRFPNYYSDFAVCVLPKQIAANKLKRKKAARLVVSLVTESEIEFLAQVYTIHSGCFGPFTFPILKMNVFLYVHFHHMHQYNMYFKRPTMKRSKKQFG